WHGGEPLAAGRDHLAALMAPFEGVEHHIQTNATLIDDAWCAFLAEREVKVGLSIDGPADLTAERVDRGGRPGYPRIMRGGAALAGTDDDLLPRQLDPIPLITDDGRAVLLSPELAGFTDPRYGDFASGRVTETPLHEIVAAAAGRPEGWIAEYLSGVEACRA